MEASNWTDHEGFKVPTVIPQDLLLIQGLVGPVISPIAADSDDSVGSSGESTDSVEEVEANLIPVVGKPKVSVL